MSLPASYVKFYAAAKQLAADFPNLRSFMLKGGVLVIPGVVWEAGKVPNPRHANDNG